MGMQETDKGCDKLSFDILNINFGIKMKSYDLMNFKWSKRDINGFINFNWEKHFYYFRNSKFIEF